MLIEGGCDDIKGAESRFFDFVVPACHGQAKRNIGALLDVRPEKALVLREDNLVVESPQNVKVGEVIEIKAGGRVPLDGVMLNEIAAFNTAALTGESVPRDIRKGEEVLAGMIVTDKVIRIKVERPSAVELLEEYGKKDARIRVIHQKNQGQSVAKNS